MKVATIDIGTNTALLLIAEVGGDGRIEPLVDVLRYPRLGKGVDANRRLDRDAVNRVIDVLREYRTLIETHRADRVVVAGTSAVRDAANREQFLEQVLEETGLRLEVLSGEEEAIWTFRGAVSGIEPSGHPVCVVDIGGGSTEVTFGAGETIRSTVSLDIGSVRMTERFFRTDPPAPEEVAAMERFVLEALSAVAPPPGETTLIGVAGTATTLALLDQGVRQFRKESVAGYSLTVERLERLCLQLRSLPVERIRALSEAMPGREDIITAGALILLAIVRRFGCGAVTVSERGIRYGLVVREAERG